MTSPEVKKLQDLIVAADHILVTSHISPDGDSVSSTILLKEILDLNFPDKKIKLSMEERPYDLDFLRGYDKIKIQPLVESLKNHRPDLLIILDANAIHRLTRQPEEVMSILDRSGIKIAIIDHHEGNEIVDNEVYINRWSSAVTLDIYDIFIDQLRYKKPKDYAQTALTGIYTDTGGFIHSIRDNERVFEVVPELIKDGADLGIIVSNLSKLDKQDIIILKDLLNNVRFGDDYTYSFIADELAVPVNYSSMIRATEIFRSHFLRNINGHPWGFLVYKDVMAKDKLYSASFRSLTGGKDVSKIAALLGGGGHKPAAGAKFEAESIDDAIRIVKAAISGAVTGT